MQNRTLQTLLALLLGIAAAQTPVQLCDVQEYSFAYCLSSQDLGPGNAGGTANSLEECARFCRRNGSDRSRYFWIGLAGGSFNCECSPAIRAGADPVDPALCNRPCPGNPDQICGGVGVGSLYVQNCFDPNPNQAQVAAGNGDTYNYAGCFDGQFLPRYQGATGPVSTLEDCASFCRSFQAFGVADAANGPNVCSCSRSNPEDRYKAADVRCTAQCAGNDGQRCGGTDGLNLYVLPGEAVSPASRVCTSVTTTSTTTVTNTATATATAPEGTVTSVCARSTITATGKASTTTITVVPTKRYTSTCYRTTTKTVSSKCRPPKSRYARETGSLVARQDPAGTCTISNGQVTFVTTTTTVTPITVTATPPDVTVCSTSTVTVTSTPTSTVTTTNTKSPVKKYYTTTSTKTVTTTKYPKNAPTCKKKGYGY
ncbi:hypothetical protein CKM354_001020700 [Cercospora kikuchii]|uniref:WSC domain-containing protein n=1 Tax=Cercospora kikuchii TaxID=84275 RepID=A0A9P3CT52_9PEZI|nr:uncharacterized protein CKM354_001020700 [Cercospora kikuchii]GIZ47107.1 hypothetical protein CKM354_001020700 [Cercospora kikuchii]